MRAVIIVVAILAVIWGGYWFAGSTAMARGVEAWFQQQAAGGKTATKTAMAVRGFPNRFDLTVDGLHLADPMTGYGWQAPFVQVFALSYKPWHVIAALPSGQVITTPDQQITLNNTKLQASVKVQPGTALALDSITLIGAELTAVSTLGWTVSATEARIATRRDPARPNAHQIGVEVTALAPDPALVAATGLPAQIEIIRLDATAAFSAALDRTAAETKPTLAGLHIAETLIRWGDLVIFAKGSLAPDANGFAEGQIDIRVENWRKLMPVLVAAGVVTPEVAPTIERAMEILAKSDPILLEVPLTFSAVRISLGPIPIGAPLRLNRP